MKKIFEIILSLFFGIFLIFVLEKVNLEFFQILIAKKLFLLLSNFFEEIGIENFSIYINKIEFVITKDCIKISAFFFLFPPLLLNKKFNLLVFLFVLLFFQNFVRIIFEIFLILKFNINLDFIFSNFQNIFQPFLIYLILVMFGKINKIKT